SQLAGQRLGRQNFVGSGRLAVVPAPAILIVAPREVGRFHKRPSQILVAAFDVALRLALAVAQALSIHQAAIAGKVAVAPEPLDPCDLHRDSPSQYATYP